MQGLLAPRKPAWRWLQQGLAVQSPPQAGTRRRRRRRRPAPPQPPVQTSIVAAARPWAAAAAACRARLHPRGTVLPSRSPAAGAGFLFGCRLLQSRCTRRQEPKCGDMETKIHRVISILCAA